MFVHYHSEVVDQVNNQQFLSYERCYRLDECLRLHPVRTNTQNCLIRVYKESIFAAGSNSIQILSKVVKPFWIIYVRFDTISNLCLRFFVVFLRLKELYSHDLFTGIAKASRVTNINN
jgi:hypothetical protein